MLDFEFQELEDELEQLVGSSETLHPIHRVVYEGGALVTATGSTNSACMLCSPSSNTRCGGGFTKCITSLDDAA